MPLAQRLKDAGIKPPAPSRKEPLWKGPEVDGITQSMLGKFLGCRERFRLLVVEGLKAEGGFNPRMEYGNLWHVCEEALAQGDPWQPALLAYCQKLCLQYRTQQEQVDHWYCVCTTQFPLYVNHWNKHPDMKGRTNLFAERVFKLQYKLPSGRVVFLRGKFDSVDLIRGASKNDRTGIWLQENKSKGSVDTVNLQRQLRFDLQTMFYSVALREGQDGDDLQTDWPDEFNDHPILGVRYNVIRRPLSGGKGSIVRHKPSKSNPQGETKESFYGRVGGIIQDSQDEYFFRWNVDVTRAEVMTFRKQFLDPILEQLCEWWDWVKGNPDPFNYAKDPSDRPGMAGIHWRHPFGTYNVLNEGGCTDVDEYLLTGSEIGLTRSDNLFPEL